MIQCKCIILSCKLRDIIKEDDYGMYSITRILTDRKIVVPKIIHEPLYYTNRYQPQIFSRHEKKVVPLHIHDESITNYTEQSRIFALRKLTSLALGFVNYDTYEKPVIIPVTPGKVFHAFLITYKGKPVITRYHYNGTRGEEVFPEPFGITENLDYIYKRVT